MEKPILTLSRKYYHPIGNNKAEICLNLRLENVEDESFRVRVLHQLGENQEILFEGTLGPSNEIELRNIVKQSQHSQSRIHAVLLGSQPIVATESKATALDDSKPFSWESKKTGIQKKEVSIAESEEKPRKRSKMNIFGTEAQPKKKRRRRFRRRRNEVKKAKPKKQLKRRARKEVEQPKQPKEKLQDLSNKGWFNVLAKVGALATALSGAGSYGAFQLYKQGVEDAKQVAHDATLIPMVPITRETSRGEYRPIHYLSSRTILESEKTDIDRWNTEAEPYFAPDANGDLTPQTSRINWSIRPITAEDVKPNGQLYFARKSLIYAEDRMAETNLGINPKGHVRAIKSLFKGEIKGGSGIHDQTCGAVWEQTGTIGSKNGNRTFSRTGINRWYREVFCGIGLGFGGQMDIDDMFATYFNYAYMGPHAFGARNFMELYWGITDLDDPKLTKGKQIILAALAKNPMPGSSEKTIEVNGQNVTLAGQERWDRHWEKEIMPRAIDYILDGMIESGELVVSDQERAEIIKEIENSIPQVEFYKKQLERRVDAPFDYVGIGIKEELNEHLKHESLSFYEWRQSADGVVTSIDPSLQYKLREIGMKSLEKQEDFARGTIFVVNRDGEYIGIYTGSKTGFDRQSSLRRLTELELPGSTGKPFVGVALANVGIHPEDRPDVANHIRVSSSRLKYSAQPVDQSLIKKGIECYGQWRTFEGKPIKQAPVAAAVDGNWDSIPNNYPAYFFSMLNGQNTPDPHFIIGEVRSGVVSEWDHEKSIPDECIDLTFGNGIAKEWTHLPFQNLGRYKVGTLSSISIPSNVELIIGKTGTAKAALNRANSSTNIVWAPFAVQFAEESYVVVNFIRAEDIDSNGFGTAKNTKLNLGNSVFSTNAVVPSSGEVLQVLSKMQVLEQEN